VWSRGLGRSARATSRPRSSRSEGPLGSDRSEAFRPIFVSPTCPTQRRRLAPPTGRLSRGPQT
jgi:hypothetical protein